LLFFIKQVTGTELGRERVVKSVVGKVTITKKIGTSFGAKTFEVYVPLDKSAVESAVKQIGKRLKIRSAQWKLENVPRMLQLRSAQLMVSLLADIFAKVRCSLANSKQSPTKV
jgi:hypothetical protein